MPSTLQILKWGQLNASGWNREGAEGLAPLLNEVQNILKQNETYQNQKYDSTTGDFPSFDTTDGVYEYDMESDIWRVSEVLLSSPIPNDLNLQLNPEYGIETNITNIIEKKEYNGKEYIRFPFVRTLDKTYDNPAKVQFKVNPTTTSGSFLVRSYLVPRPQITSSRIQLSIPEKYHMTVVLPSLMLLVEAFQTNNWTEAIEIIEKKYKPLMMKEMNEGEQGECSGTRRREF